MKDEKFVLRLRLVGTGAETGRRAALVVDRLAAKRAVEGECPEWRITYMTVDHAAAFRLLEADLNAIDERWIEALDFSALRSRHRSSLEVGRDRPALGPRAKPNPG